MNLTLKIWRQANADATGSIETYPIENVSPDMSFGNDGCIKRTAHWPGHRPRGF